MHEYLEEQAAHRLTWIVIWLIVAACLVEAVCRYAPPVEYRHTFTAANWHRARWWPGWSSILYLGNRVTSYSSKAARWSSMA